MLWETLVNDNKTYELIDELYSYFIDYLNIRDEKTYMGRQLYRIIEKEVLKHYGTVSKNDFEYITKQDINEIISIFSKKLDKRKLH
jgi:hypothetical protein